ncbi:MAG: cytochrome c oxidase assembly protein [Acidimicrobiia bacterium]
MITLVVGYWWALRRLGPYYAPKDKPAVTGWQITSFLAAVASLWVVSDWPLHDIAEEALVSVHMIEHLTLALIFPPLILLGVPSWLWQVLLGPVIPFLRRITHPMVGLFVFNTVFAATHWPPVLAIQNQSEWWHLTGHLILVVSGFLMFWPVFSPLPQIRRLTPFRSIGYLFLNTILPTVPASFLTFTNRFLYIDAYPTPDRLWDVDRVVDQQVAGLLMKLGGGIILWTMITVMFFRWASAERHDDAARPTEVASR